ncbi:MAG: hypothetical protein AABZ39_21160 [Spirochaetota bacterium]
MKKVVLFSAVFALATLTVFGQAATTAADSKMKIKLGGKVALVDYAISGKPDIFTASGVCSVSLTSFLGVSLEAGFKSLALSGATLTTNQTNALLTSTTLVGTGSANYLPIGLNVNWLLGDFYAGIGLYQNIYLNASLFNVKTRVTYHLESMENITSVKLSFGYTANLSPAVSIVPSVSVEGFLPDSIRNLYVSLNIALMLSL